MNINSLARVILCLVLAALGPAGCAGSKSSSTAAATPAGELIAETVNEWPGNSDDAKEAIRCAIDLFKRMPQDVGVRLVEQSEYRVVAEMDWCQYVAAFVHSPGDQPDGTRVPVRQVWEAVPHGDTIRIVMQVYYTGDDPAMAQRLRDIHKETDPKPIPQSP